MALVLFWPILAVADLAEAVFGADPAHVVAWQQFLLAAWLWRRWIGRRRFFNVAGCILDLVGDVWSWQRGLWRIWRTRFSWRMRFCGAGLAGGVIVVGEDPTEEVFIVVECFLIGLGIFGRGRGGCGASAKPKHPSKQSVM